MGTNHSLAEVGDGSQAKFSHLAKKLFADLAVVTVLNPLES